MKIEFVPAVGQMREATRGNPFCLTVAKVPGMKANRYHDERVASQADPLALDVIWRKVVFFKNYLDTPEFFECFLLTIGTI